MKVEDLKGFYRKGFIKEELDELDVNVATRPPATAWHRPCHDDSQRAVPEKQGAQGGNDVARW